MLYWGHLPTCSISLYPNPQSDLNLVILCHFGVQNTFCRPLAWRSPPRLASKNVSLRGLFKLKRACIGINVSIRLDCKPCLRAGLAYAHSVAPSPVFYRGGCTTWVANNFVLLVGVPPPCGNPQGTAGSSCWVKATFTSKQCIWRESLLPAEVRRGRRKFRLG